MKLGESNTPIIYCDNCHRQIRVTDVLCILGVKVGRDMNDIIIKDFDSKVNPFLTLLPYLVRQYIRYFNICLVWKGLIIWRLDSICGQVEILV